jgi:hypothetical protein
MRYVLGSDDPEIKRLDRYTLQPLSNASGPATMYEPKEFRHIKDPQSDGRARK